MFRIVTVPATSKERSRSGLYDRPFGRSRGLVDGCGNPKRLPHETATR